MKTLYYILLALACVLAVAVFILLGYAFSTKEPHKKYEITGYSLLGVCAVVFTCFLVLNSKLKENYIKFENKVYSYTQESEKFTINYIEDTETIYFFVDNNKGERTEKGIDVNSVKVIKTDTISPSLFKIKKIWELKPTYELYIPVDSMIL